MKINSNKPVTDLAGYAGALLPKPSKEALIKGYRIPDTNLTLSNVGFTDDAQRDNLFKAFGKDTILYAIALYFGAAENYHRNTSLESSSGRKEVLADIRSGLVATMESIRTRGRKLTEYTILNGDNIVDEVRSKYSKGRRPALRLRTEEDINRLDLLKSLIQTYVMANSGKGSKDTMALPYRNFQGDSVSQMYSPVEAALSNGDYTLARQHYDALLAGLEGKSNGKGIRFVKKRLVDMSKEAFGENDGAKYNFINSLIRKLPAPTHNRRHERVSKENSPVMGGLEATL